MTSISCDHHKYGQAPKGVSAIMYSKKDILYEAFFTSCDWSGGLYMTASSAGSRNGASSVGACNILILNLKGML